MVGPRARPSSHAAATTIRLSGLGGGFGGVWGGGGGVWGGLEFRVWGLGFRVCKVYAVDKAYKVYKG